jgi:hypothetical protein
MYKCNKCSSQFYFKSHLKDHEDFKHPNRAAEPIRTYPQYEPLGTATAARDRLRWTYTNRISSEPYIVTPEAVRDYQYDLFTQYWVSNTSVVGIDNTVA